MDYNKEDIIEICNSIDTSTIINFGKNPPPFDNFFKLEGLVYIHSFHDVYFHNDFIPRNKDIYLYIDLTNSRIVTCHFDYMMKYYLNDNKVQIIKFNSLVRLNKIKKLCKI